MITIKNMSFSYVKGNDLLKDINLNIPNGVYLSVLGENGSCKSTLIKLILGLLKPDCGSIEINTKKISYVPQRLDNFNAEFPIKLKDSKAVSNVLEKVNMDNFKNNLIGNLSGGQQQRIFIARALLGNPDLIILDEPSTGVDEKSQMEIYPLLQDLNKNHGKTIISVEHNTRTALKYSTHILKLQNGSMKLYTKDEFIKYLEHENSISNII